MPLLDEAGGQRLHIKRGRADQVPRAGERSVVQAAEEDRGLDLQETGQA